MKRLLMTGLLIFGAISSGKVAMAKKIDKEALANKIKALAGLDAEERSELLGLLSERKKYGLVWEEKPEDVVEVMREQLPVLAEVKERAIVTSTPSAPNHILIEGDNLHALTCLTYTHSNKVDVIYIDPPYNTGNKDFVYNDRFVDKEDAFRHSKWLSFMEKRLRIAKGLLSDKGVIFISIDDNEQAQLKLLCDEIFGEENFVNQFIWKRNSSGKTEKDKFTVNTEYVLLYKKSAKCILNSAYKPLADATIALYKKDDHDGRGRYRLYPLQKPSSPGPETTYDYVDNHGKVWKCPPKGWRIKFEKLKALENDGRLCLENETLSEKAYWNERASEGKRIDTLWIDLPENTAATKEVSALFGGEVVFTNPKPTELIKRCLQVGFANATILDFFAGSGTTLHAVMKLNAEDGGKRTCILVTNNENGICEKVTYERNRRVIQGYTNTKGEAVPGLQDNSLRYYKTEFVPRRPSPRNARALMAASVDLLCVKNDLYDEVPRFFGKKLKKSAGRYFDDGRGRRMLVLFDEMTVPSVAETIRGASFKGKVKIYVFAHGDYAYNEEFEEVADKVELCALPAAIRNAYRRVIGKYRPQEDVE